MVVPPAGGGPARPPAYSPTLVDGFPRQGDLEVKHVGEVAVKSLAFASDEATTAYAAGDCIGADRFAQSSIDVLGTRAPPWQIKALCAVDAGKFDDVFGRFGLPPQLD